MATMAISNLAPAAELLAQLGPVLGLGPAAEAGPTSSCSSSGSQFQSSGDCSPAASSGTNLWGPAGAWCISTLNPRHQASLHSSALSQCRTGAALGTSWPPAQLVACPALQE